MNWLNTEKQLRNMKNEDAFRLPRKYKTGPDKDELVDQVKKLL